MNRPCTFIAVLLLLILSISSAGHAQASIWPIGSPYLTKAASVPSSSRELPKSFATVSGGFEQRVNSNGEAEYLSRALHSRLVLRKNDILFNTSQERNVSRPIRLTMDDTNDGTEIIPEKEPIYTLNYLLGADHSTWRQNVPVYEAIRYSHLYHGIDALFHSNEQGIEYDDTISPGADPDHIKLSFSGAVLLLDKTGDLLAKAGGRTIRLKKPLAYQLNSGVRTSVECRYRLSGHQIHFALGQYNQQHPLIIDPIISYGTYIGGSGAENIQSIAVDRFGSAYVTGTATLPTDLTGTPNAFQQTAIQADVIFVAKLDPSGSRFEYLTYIGGTDPTKASAGRDIAVDATGSTYISGATIDRTYPTTPGAFQTFFAQQTAVISKLSPAGDALIFSTFLSSPVVTDRQGSGATAIAIDSSQAVFVTGFVTAPDFPVTAGAAQPTFGGIEDAFIAKISPDGSALLYSTYIGGSDQDQAFSIAVDHSGNAYVAGQARSLNFPTTPGAFKTTQNAFVSGNTFIAKINVDGTAFIYSTLLGSGDEFSEDTPGGIVVDHEGDAIVVGFADDRGFPVTPGAYQTVFPGNAAPAFVTKLSSDGSHLIFSTFLGGPGTATISATNFATAVALDAQENIVVIGQTGSSTFPITSGGLASASPGDHGFVSILNGTGTELLFSSYISGSGFDLPFGVAVDDVGGIFVSGLTTSTDFPTTPGAAQIKYGGGARDGFVVKVMRSTAQGLITVSTNNPDATFTITDGNGHIFSGAGASFTQMAPPGTYNIQYGAVQGFLTPSFQTQTLTVGGTVNFTGTYLPAGNITVTTNLITAIFKIDGPVVLNGNGTSHDFTNVPAGVYKITYGGLPDCFSGTPAQQTQTLIDGNTVIFKGDYQVGFLSFPLPGADPCTANISTVFDHSQTRPYSRQKAVTAYTGEQGGCVAGSTDICESKVSKTSHFGFIKQGAVNIPFFVNGSYTGGKGPCIVANVNETASVIFPSCRSVLFYNGHPGIDYPANCGTVVYAAADGIVHYPLSIPGILNAPKFHVLELDVSGAPGYKIYYLHLSSYPNNHSKRKCESEASIAEGESVKAGQPIGLTGDEGVPGAFHLHFEVQLNQIPVDPYGWKGESMMDPYVKNRGVASKNLWK